MRQLNKYNVEVRQSWYNATRLMKLAIIFSFLACSCNNSRRELTYSVAGMIELVNMDHDGTIASLLGNGYTLNSSDVIQNQRITIMTLNTKSTNAKMLKGQWTDSGKLYRMVHFDLKPLTLDTGIYSELLKLNFKLKESSQHGIQSYKLYTKDLYTISIYRFIDKTLPLAVEFHKLP
jgi:hypothetical protein